MNGAMFRSQSSPDRVRSSWSALGSFSESLEMLITSRSEPRCFGPHGDDNGGSGIFLAREREVEGVGNDEDDGGSAGEEDRKTLNGDGERDESESDSKNRASARFLNDDADTLVLGPGVADDGVG